MKKNYNKNLGHSYPELKFQKLFSNVNTLEIFSFICLFRLIIYLISNDPFWDLGWVGLEWQG